MAAKSELKVMSFGEHLEELRTRVVRSLAVALCCTIVAFFFQDLLMKEMTAPHRRAMAQVEGRQGYQKVLDRLEKARLSLGDLSAPVALAAVERSKQEEAWFDRWQQMRATVESQGEGSPLAALARLVEERLGLLEREVVERSSAGQFSARLATLTQRLSAASLSPPWGAGPTIDASAEEVEKIALMVAGWERAREPVNGDNGAAPSPAVAEEISEEALQRLVVVATDLDATSTELARLQDWRTQARPLQLLSYTESFFSHLKLCLLVGVLIGLPWISFEVWGFIAAGLYLRERKAVFLYLPASFFSLLLGLLFAYWVLVPVGLTYLGSYGTGELLQPGFTLREYMGLVFTLLLGMGIVFQLPLVMVFLANSGAVKPSQFRQVQKYALLSALVVAAMLTPPDVVTQVLMAGPLILLYEVGIWASVLILRRPGRIDSKGAEEA